MHGIALVFGLFFATNVNAASAVSDAFCQDRSALIHKLETTYGAERQGRRTRGPDALVEVWIVPKTGEWTLVQTYANGGACVVAMGENWEVLARPVDPASS